jgi:tetratricopeptide (TPR) repeat protein
VARVRTTSPGAYALYDEGLRAFFGYDAPAAHRLMTAALARDSSFAMAAWYAWWLSRILGLPDSTTTSALQRVQRLAPRTIERERLLIQASVAEVVAPLLDAVAIAETLTVKYPEDPDGQYQLGAAREHQGDWAAAVAAYQRAFVLDSMAGALSGPYCRVCYTLGAMARAYLWWDSAGAAERVNRKLIALRPNEWPAAGSLVEILARQGRRAEAEAITLSHAGLSTAAARSGSLDRDLLRWGRYEEADRELTELLGSRSGEIRDDAKWLLLLSLRDQGRLREAHTLVQRWHVPSPPPVPVDLALLGVELGRPSLTIRAHRDNAVSAARSTLPVALRARSIAWNLVLAGTAHAAAGDTAVVRRLVDSLERIGRNSNWARDTRLHHVLRGLLLQREGKHGEAVDAFNRSLYSLTDGYTRTNLMLAGSLLALGRGAQAIGVLQPAIRGGVDGSNSYVSRTELHEALAQAFEQAGQQDSAVAHWRAVESAFRRADPQFRDRYLYAKLKAGR